jgi:DNA-directed RNA polymerase specialized sigma24 family protein
VIPKGWSPSTPPELRELAERACAGWPRQLQALQLVSHGLGAKLIGLALGIDESSARGLLRRARRNVQAERAAEQGLKA